MDGIYKQSTECQCYTMDDGPFYIFWAILEAIRNGLAYTPVKFMLGGIIAAGIAMYFIVY